MRRRLLLGLLMIGALWAGHARANEFNGIWSGSVGKERGEVTIKAEFVGEVARFKIEFKSWPGYGETANCRYYARLDDNVRGELILSPEYSSNDCAPRGRVGIARHRLEQITVSLSGLMDIPDFTLDERVRPIGEWERATLPENFDILGVSLGMTREEIEKNLIEGRGFVLALGDRVTFRYYDFVSEMITYHRSSEIGTNDEVIVAYSIRHSDAPKEQDYATLVRRQSRLGRGPKLTVDALRQALTRKYGAPTRGDDRRYDREGGLVDDHHDPMQFCEAGARQKIIDHYFGRSRTFQSHCGSELDVDIDTDRLTGLVDRYQLTLSSVDFLNNSDWVYQALNMAVEAETFLEAMEGAATSDPEL